MSIDLDLLEKTISNKKIIFTLRFYLWEGDWISIGYHQKNLPNHWMNLSDKGLLNIVRRPSGGGAVLHSGGITYALTFNKPEYKKFSYQLINNWLIKSFQLKGISLKNGITRKTTITENCFSTNFISDLLDKNGNKRIGSAQYWRKGAFLQHGEIQLNPPLKLWEKVFNEEPPPPIKLNLSKEEIIEHLKVSFLRIFDERSTENIFLQYEELKNHI